MPIFEYKCSDCGKVSEFLEKQNPETAHKCPDCGSKNMKKQFSTFSAHVKQPAAKNQCHSCPSGGTCPNSMI